MEIEIITASHTHRSQLISLLEKEKLPTIDLPSVLESFFLAKRGNIIIGVIGLEQYENCGLLRSMVVDQQYRNKNVASQLVQVLEKHAQSIGIQEIFLLTETAANYFNRKGYREIPRIEVPSPIQTSSEFSTACPVSATVMRKSLHVIQS